MEQRRCHLDLWNALKYLQNRPEAIWGCEWLDVENIPEDWNLDNRSWKRIETEHLVHGKYLWIAENDGGPEPNQAFNKLKCSHEFTCRVLNDEGHLDISMHGNPWRVKLILV